MSEEKLKQANIGSINGPTHFGQGDININYLPMEDIKKLMAFLSNEAEGMEIASRLIQELSLLRVENCSLKAQIKTLEDERKERLLMIADPQTHTYLWKDSLGVMFQCCPVCWEKEKKRIFLQENDADAPSDVYCPVCHCVYKRYTQDFGNTYLAAVMHRR